jgi:hypothetical protein
MLWHWSILPWSSGAELGSSHSYGRTAFGGSGCP